MHNYTTLVETTPATGQQSQNTDSVTAGSAATQALPKMFTKPQAADSKIAFQSNHEIAYELLLDIKSKILTYQDTIAGEGDEKTFRRETFNQDADVIREKVHALSEIKDLGLAFPQTSALLAITMFGIGPGSIELANLAFFNFMKKYKRSDIVLIACQNPHNHAINHAFCIIGKTSPVEPGAVIQEYLKKLNDDCVVLDVLNIIPGKNNKNFGKFLEYLDFKGITHIVDERRPQKNFVADAERIFADAHKLYKTTTIVSQFASREEECIETTDWTHFKRVHDSFRKG